MVTSSNQKLVPSFGISGFEFTDIEQVGLDKDFTMEDFGEMLRDIVQNTPVGGAYDGPYESTLEKLGKRFGEQRGLLVKLARVSCLDKSVQEGRERGIHFDRGNGGIVRFWMPTKDLIYKLVMGDASKVGGAAKIRHVPEGGGATVTEGALQEIPWYQKEYWNVGEFAAFLGSDVPHGVFKGEGKGGHVIVVTYRYIKR